MIKENIIMKLSVDTMQKLVEQGKLELNNVDVLVNKYS